MIKGDTTMAPVRKLVQPTETSNTHTINQDNEFSEFKKLLKSFGTFKQTVKVFKEGISYKDLEEEEVVFSASLLNIENLYDDSLILEEVSKIPQRIYIYGVIYESQSKVVQLLEDEFERWKADKYSELESELEPVLNKDGSVSTYKKVQRTATTINQMIISKYKTEYEYYQNKLASERYKLGLLKCVVQSLDNYSYKLHSIHNHLQKLLEKNSN